MKQTSILLVLFLVANPLLIYADEIVRKNGEVIKGKIEKITTEYYHIRTKDGKLRKIKPEDIKKLRFESLRKKEIPKEVPKEIPKENKSSKLSLYEQYKVREISPWGGFVVSLLAGFGAGHYIVGSTESGVIFTLVEAGEILITVSGTVWKDYTLSYVGLTMLYLTRLAEIISIFPVVDAKNEATKKELGISFNPKLYFNKDKINLTLLSYKF